MTKFNAQLNEAIYGGFATFSFYVPNEFVADFNAATEGYVKQQKGTDGTETNFLIELPDV